jgi:hypothetical protein
MTPQQENEYIAELEEKIEKMKKLIPPNAKIHKQILEGDYLETTFIHTTAKVYPSEDGKSNYIEVDY